MRSLRAAAILATGAGTAGSAALFVRASLHTPRPLLVIMAIWVFAPFAVMVAALMKSTHWPAPLQSTLYVATTVVTLGALAVYIDDALGHRTAQAAFVYVMVPPASLLVLAVALLIARLSVKTSRM